MTTATKQRRCLVERKWGTEFVHYKGYNVEVTLPREEFEEMGEPELLTVTIDRGDLLNNEEVTDG